jgi:uncharacterized protein YndB with AHSA1/START domain
MNLKDLAIDPTLDLVLERVVPVPVSRVWRAWTVPANLMKWFCPLPWRTTECAIDLRPGGAFYTKMEGPSGESNAGTGCYLVIDHERSLVWTDSMGPGFRPKADGFMVGILLLEPVEGGTRYTAIARHASPDVRAQHEAMGFAEGWGAALDQLVQHADSME